MRLDNHLQFGNLYGDLRGQVREVIITRAFDQIEYPTY
jgi:hypothetical protein